MTAAKPADPRYLRIKEVQARLGVGRSTIYDWSNPNSPRFDDTFPRQVKIGATTARWVEAEVTDWIVAQIEARERRAKH